MSGYLIVFIGGGNRGGSPPRSEPRGVGPPGARPPSWDAVRERVGWLFMGALAGVFLARTGLSEDLRLFLTTGLLGGFATFSAFSLEAALMWQRGDYTALAGYTVRSVLLPVVALFAGMGAVRAFA